MADERLCNPISTAELERRWAAVRDAMPEQKLDALIVQGANNLAGTGGYFRWFTGVSMATSYPATVIFPRDGLMTLVSHGPMGVERLPEGVTAAPIGGVQLAGFPGDVEVLELTGVPAPADNTDTGELWTRSPFI